MIHKHQVCHIYTVNILLLCKSGKDDAIRWWLAHLIQVVSHEDKVHSTESKLCDKQKYVDNNAAVIDREEGEMIMEH